MMMMTFPQSQLNPEDNTPDDAEHPPRRWYDRDPALAKALESLRMASSRFHAQVALNIISVIVEHRLEELQKKHSFTAEELHQHFLENAKAYVMPSYGKRWYDVNETLQSAIQLLKDTPDDIQKQIIPSIALVIEQAIARDLNED